MLCFINQFKGNSSKSGLSLGPKIGLEWIQIVGTDIAHLSINKRHACNMKEEVLSEHTMKHWSCFDPSLSNHSEKCYGFTLNSTMVIFIFLFT